MNLSSLRRTFVFLALAACAFAVRADDSYRIVHTYPHDPHAYTQGLIYVDGHLYESTGLNGRSSLRMEDLATGSRAAIGDGAATILCRRPCRVGQHADSAHLAIARCLRLRPLQLSPAAHLHYDCDGWGLTADGKNLILSDGTAELRFFDPATFREVRHIYVSGPRRSP